MRPISIGDHAGRTRAPRRSPTTMPRRRPTQERPPSQIPGVVIACGTDRAMAAPIVEVRQGSARSSDPAMRRPCAGRLLACRAWARGRASRERAMRLDALWHDLECSAYDEDLPRWRSLAAEAGGPVLDVGAGTGRVTLDLAAPGLAVVALDSRGRAARSARAPCRRAGGRDRRSPTRATSRSVRRFALILLPMQTLQLLGGPRVARPSCAARAPSGAGRTARRGGGRRDGLLRRRARRPPPPDACDVADVRYASHLLAVVEEDGRAAIHRRREITGRPAPACRGRRRSSRPRVGGGGRDRGGAARLPRRAAPPNT